MRLKTVGFRWALPIEVKGSDRGAAMAQPEPWEGPVRDSVVWYAEARDR